ncbi:MAG: inositol monophosphatase [Syntrophomonadaceae bacterium]|mgnify:CR=1 FL=1|nr:inositol monophosphatase [Syntrophomonadaceae bacterium]
MLEELCVIVKKAGDIILSADMSKTRLEQKSSPGDFVTAFDIAVQEMLREELKRLLPEARFIGEESSREEIDTKGYCFIVDPIDGTANFAWDYRHSAVSIALAYNEKIIMGLVYNPYLDELFYAEAGKGAFLNGNRIWVSKRRLKDGLVCFGSSPYDKTKAEATFSLAGFLYKKALDVRRSGSAALDLCYIASGRCDLFYEMSLSPWDYAAASLIVTEADGVITNMRGERLQFREKSSVLAGGRNAYHDFWRVYGEFRYRRTGDD